MSRVDATSPAGRPGYTVLVNSSDGFEDCWDPFFTLFNRYWPDCRAPLLLNTECKQYGNGALNVVSTRVQSKSPVRLTWSECLLAALAHVETPLVLYFQEDYFIHRPVLDSKIGAAASFMLANPDVAHVALTRFGSHGPYEPHPFEWLQTIRQKARYRISTQAALWRVDSLTSYLVPEENGWMFEIYGTWRAQRRRDTFLCMRFDAGSGGPAIDYLHTGIIKGKWLPGIETVFERNGISVDFSRRGFYTPKHPILRRLETARRLLERPQYLLKQLI